MMENVRFLFIHRLFVQHDHITLDRFVQALPVYPTVLAFLFIYCNFGNELTVKVGRNQKPKGEETKQFVCNFYFSNLGQ